MSLTNRYRRSILSATLIFSTFVYSMAKHVTLTPLSNSVDGAQVILWDETTVNTQANVWEIDATDPERYFAIEVSLSSSWGFHTSLPSYITLTIDSDTPTETGTDLEIIMSFSVDKAQYWSTLLHADADSSGFQAHTIGPLCDTSTPPKSSSQLFQGDVKDKVDSSTKLRGITNGAWNGHDTEYAWQPPNNILYFPFQFRIENIPGENVMYVYHIQSSYTQKCGFAESFRTGKGLQIYLHIDAPEFLSVKSFQVEYFDESTANPTTALPTTSDPTTANPTTALPTISDPTTINPTTITARTGVLLATTIKETSAMKSTSSNGNERAADSQDDNNEDSDIDQHRDLSPERTTFDIASVLLIIVSSVLVLVTCAMCILLYKCVLPRYMARKIAKIIVDDPAPGMQKPAVAPGGPGHATTRISKSSILNNDVYALNRNQQTATRTNGQTQSLQTGVELQQHGGSICSVDVVGELPASIDSVVSGERNLEGVIAPNIIAAPVRPHQDPRRESNQSNSEELYHKNSDSEEMYDTQTKGAATTAGTVGKCADCQKMVNDKRYQMDGLFYCPACWAWYYE